MVKYIGTLLSDKETGWFCFVERLSCLCVLFQRVPICAQSKVKSHADLFISRGSQERLTPLTKNFSSNCLISVFLPSCSHCLPVPEHVLPMRTSTVSAGFAAVTRCRSLRALIHLSGKSGNTGSPKAGRRNTKRTHQVNIDWLRICVQQKLLVKSFCVLPKAPLFLSWAVPFVLSPVWSALHELPPFQLSAV